MMIADEELGGELVLEDREDRIDRQQLRAHALDLAVAFLGPHGDVDRVMAAAVVFLAFLRADDGEGGCDAGADPAAEPG